MTDSDRIEPLADTAPVTKNPDDANLSATTTATPAQAEPASGKPVKTAKADGIHGVDETAESNGEEPPRPRRRGRGRPPKSESTGADNATPKATPKTVTADTKAATPKSTTSPKAPKAASSRSKTSSSADMGAPAGSPGTSPDKRPAKHATTTSATSAAKSPVETPTRTPEKPVATPAGAGTTPVEMPALTACPVQAPVIASPLLPVSVPRSAVPATSAPAFRQSAPISSMGAVLVSFSPERGASVTHGSSGMSGNFGNSGSAGNAATSGNSGNAGMSGNAGTSGLSDGFGTQTADPASVDGEAAPAKRRRSRRSGRGRKRPVDGSTELAGGLMPEDADRAEASDEPATVQPGAVIALGESGAAGTPGTTDKPKSRSRRRKPAAKTAQVADDNLFAVVTDSTAIPMPAAAMSTFERDEADDLDETDDTFFEMASENTEALVMPAEAGTEEETDQSPRKSRSRGRGRKKSATARAAAVTADEDMDERDDDIEEEDEDGIPTKSGRAKKPAPGEIRKMLVSVLPGDQVEVVLTEAGKLCEYYVEMSHQAKIRGNIYKGIINNIDANLQAAFVNYGNVKNGFLQIDEVHPEYYLQPHEPMKGRKYPPMQKVLKAGQEVLVQVVKEPTGNKGAFLTTWVSLAGRFLVLTPGQEQIGISRKVEDGDERNRLRELIKGLEPGEGLGAIVRTVSAGTSKTTLQKDLSFLKRVWKDIRKRATTEKSPSLIYQEPGLASRSVRDYLSDDVTEVWVDDSDTAESIREMAGLLFPRKADLVHLYEDRHKTLWEQFGVLKQIEQVQAREVIMPSGGRLVFDQTEALMAIDINSGRIGGKTNFESMAHRTNMEAAVAIAQQLRLRDIGGQIVIDFIEMRDPEHGREVEKALRNAMKGDRARHDIGKMSSFGLLQIVRQRTGSSAISISMEPCPHCKGTGQRRNLEWQAVQILPDLNRAMRLAAASGQIVCLYTMDVELGLYLLNHKRERMSALEKECNIRLEVLFNGVSSAPASVAQPNGKSL